MGLGFYLQEGNSKSTDNGQPSKSDMKEVQASRDAVSVVYQVMSVAKNKLSNHYNP